jgi:hypothetical protein
VNPQADRLGFLLVFLFHKAAPTAEHIIFSAGGAGVGVQLWAYMYSTGSSSHKVQEDLPARCVTVCVVRGETGIAFGAVSLSGLAILITSEFALYSLRLISDCVLWLSVAKCPIYVGCLRCSGRVGDLFDV